MHDVQADSDLTDVTNVSNAPSQAVGDGPSFFGCFVNLAPAGQYTYSPDPATSYMAERAITDPLATSGGVAFFTTFQPYTDLCELGGKSFIWALQYDTCGLPTNMKGVAIVQVSTGAIQQENLSQIFAGSRKSGAIEGKPPEAQGLSVQTSPAAGTQVYPCAGAVRGWKRQKAARLNSVRK